MQVPPQQHRLPYTKLTLSFFSSTTTPYFYIIEAAVSAPGGYEHGEEEDDEDDDDDDDVDDSTVPTFTTKMPTSVVEEGLLQQLEHPVENAMEDGLFSLEVMPTTEEILKQTADKPLQSILPQLSLAGWKTSKASLQHQRINAEKRREINIQNLCDTTESRRETEHAAVVSKAKQDAAFQQWQLAKTEHKANQDELSRLQKEAHNYQLMIRGAEKTMAVANALEPCLDTLISHATNQPTGFELPFAQETEAALPALAGRFGLSDYRSTKLSTRKHISIAGALKGYGFLKSEAYSAYFNKHGRRSLQANKSVPKVELRRQTCNVFQIPIPEDTKPSPATKRTATFSTPSSHSARKRAKTNRSAFDQSEAAAAAAANASNVAYANMLAGLSPHGTLTVGPQQASGAPFLNPYLFSPHFGNLASHPRGQAAAPDDQTNMSTSDEKDSGS